MEESQSGSGRRGGGRGVGGSRAKKQRGPKPPKPTQEEVHAILCPKNEKGDRRLVDIGFNLKSKMFRPDLDEVLARARQSGVVACICTGTDVKSSASNLEACQSMQAPLLLRSTVGVHPHSAKEMFPDLLGAVDKLKTLITQQDGGKTPVVVAVGECGLDYNRMFSPKEQQLAAFRAQLNLARELNLPVFMHERDGFEDAFSLLKEEFNDVVLNQGVVVHCFTGTDSELMAYLSIGCYIGITSFVCKRARGEDLRSYVSKGLLPLERLMLETDAPYMAPDLKDQHGKRLYVPRNEPGAVAHVASTLAQCYGCSTEEVAQATTENAMKFFRLQQELLD